MSNPWSETADPAANAFQVLKAWLLANHWAMAKQSQWRKDPNDFAVELRYVYGECTVHINRLDGVIDRGTVVTMRGTSQGFVLNVVKEIERREDAHAEI